jgi:hypothetical protein
MIFMTRRVFWRVLSVSRYEGTCEDLQGAFVADTDCGPLTLEQPVEVLVWPEATRPA